MSTLFFGSFSRKNTLFARTILGRAALATSPRSPPGCVPPSCTGEPASLPPTHPGGIKIFTKRLMPTSSWMKILTNCQHQSFHSSLCLRCASPTSLASTPISSLPSLPSCSPEDTLPPDYNRWYTNCKLISTCINHIQLV